MIESGDRDGVYACQKGRAVFPRQKSLYELSFLDNDLPLKMLMPIEEFSASFLIHILVSY